MLLLRCPTTQATEGSSEGRTDFIASLVQIAGTEQYGNKALATSGFSRRPLHTSDSTFGVIAYGPERRSSLDGQHDEVIYRQLSESRPVDMPYGNLFVKSEWLAALAISSEDQSSQEQQQGRGGIIAELGRRLDHQLKVKTWALPLPFHGTHAPLVHQAEFLNYARQLLGDSAVAAEDPTGMDRTLGSPAKIAVLLSNPDLEYATSWMNIICGFADEAIYGHEVQVFSSLDVEDGRDFVLECLEVEVHTLTADSLRAWTPDICLASVEAAGTRIALDPSYFTISTPGAELAHLDWLHALPLESLLNWNVPKIDLAVITNNRPVSLHRLLSSLRLAHYLGDKVNLLLNLEQTTDDQTHSVLEGSQWPFGDVSVRHRVVLGGLMTSIVESWYPINNDTYGVLLEDDVEVSPLFYSWLKFTILYYRYGTRAMRRQSERLYGISLYQPKNIELRPEGRRKFDAHKLLEEVGLPPTLPYLSQIPCSWGAVYFPEHWREFHQFLSIRLSEAALDLSDPIVPNIRSNRWPNSWKRYLIELVYLRGYSMLYPNYADFKSLSTNHLEQGTHVKDEAQAQKRRDLFEVPLLSDEDNLVDELPDGKLPSWPTLPVIDFWGGLTNEQEIIERSQSTFEEMELCPNQPTSRQPQPENEEIEYALLTGSSLDHNAAKLLCNGPMDEQDWKEWRMRVQRGANEIDVRMLLEHEARLDEREKRIIEMEQKLHATDYIADS
ncbi:hypothetical protein P389DRAFT_154079 [Cystobasidium minutum MCA 4210]|uniref:uncharacterized protein n=1 Tax=Cystobasidium minutum MCA 4210 TaxID=1397322 RepID=UPI0034CF1D6E|eukprot:jgi/Rhomi1/154079/estExt_Genewise1.C_5_t20087